MSARQRPKERKNNDWLLAFIQSLLVKSMRKCLDIAIDDLLKEWGK